MEYLTLAAFSLSCVNSLVLMAVGMGRTSVSSETPPPRPRKSAPGARKVFAVTDEIAYERELEERRQHRL